MPVTGTDGPVFPVGQLLACPVVSGCAPTVVFGRRRGYLRIALGAGVPIVPLATIGSHFTWTSLPGGDVVARRLGLKRLARIERLPMPLAAFVLLGMLPGFGLGIFPLPVMAGAALAAALPNPVPVTSEVLRPIDVAAETAHVEDEETRLELGHQIVARTLARAVRGMRHDRPWVGEGDRE